MNPFLGQMVLFAGNFAPRGWALCEGQLLSINSYQALFSILGTIYGGDGRTTFALPDLRGRAPVSPGTGPGLRTWKQGERIGSEETYLNTNNMPSHTHPNSLNHGGEDNLSATADGMLLASDARGGVTPLGIYVGGTATGSLRSDALTVGMTGSGLPFNNQQPSLGLYYIIALEGVFPSRN
jgi:microcystin-dependent protein